MVTNKYRSFCDLLTGGTLNFFEALRIHLRLGLIIIFVVPTLAWLCALLITPIYESNARLLIEVKDLGFKGGLQSPFETVARFSDPIRTQIEILQSSTILDNVIRKFNLRYKKGPKKGQYLSYLELREQFDVQAGRGVDILELHYKDPNPKIARDILQAVTDNYIAKTIELKASDTASAIRFLKRERNKAEREALDASKRLRIFEENSKTVDLETNKEIVQNTYRLKSLRLQVESDYVKVKTTADHLSRQLKITFDNAILNSTISQDPFLQSLRKDLLEKQSKLIKLETKVKPGHYQLQEVKDQIKGNQKLIEERVRELVGREVDPDSVPFAADPVRAELTKTFLQAKSAEIAAAEQLAVVDKALNETTEKLLKLPSEKYIYSQLRRQNEIAQKRLEEIDLKLIESRMQGVIASHITNIRLIDPPSLALNPKFPDVSKTLIIGFVFGILLASLVIYLVEYFDDIIKGTDTLPKELTVPFLGQLPEVHIGDLPVVYKEPRSEYTEAVHSLRTNLSFLSLSGERKLLLVTSPGVGEGKSSAAISLAITYAQTGKRVLLIEADIRNPSLYKYLARPKEAVGISNTLIKEIDFYDVVQKSVLGIVGFDYLPAGDIPPNPVQLLESDEMSELVETSKHIYDLVIIDTPPIGLFSDALLLARYSDVVALVTRYNKSSRKELVAAVNLLHKANVSSIGIVLNAVPSTTSSYGYGYGYGYYSEKPKDSESFASGSSAA